jgi:16S rRNA (cytidine1402-2'-O)-methyltransferase
MKQGTLLVVATPIGNLEDLSPRGRRALEEADLIVAEDTRRTGRLLEAHGLDRPLTSCHKFSEASRLEPLLEALSEGRTLALVTDGGTPAVSDPGRRLVAAALKAGARVVAVAGPSAVTAALSISGFPADRFLFAGFLPSKTTERRKEAAQLAAFAGTIVLFEAPHRLLDCLADLELVLGERPAALCREMTKRFEEVVRGPLPHLRQELAAREEIRGECVLVIGPDPSAGERPLLTGTTGQAVSEEDRAAAEAYERALEHEDGDARRALKRAARELGLPRAEVKRRVDRSR